MRSGFVVPAIVILASALGATPNAVNAQTGPKSDETVLEMTPATVDRFAKALAAEESSRKAIAAKAAASVPKATKTKEEYANCQMELMMSPEFQQKLQEMTAAVTGKGNDPTAAGKAMQEMQASTDAAMLKACGPDPDKTYSKPDVGGMLRKAQSEAAKANGFTDRQYAVIKERVTPLCLSDPAAAGADGLKIRGEGRVFWVYTSGEVEALKPHCDEFMKLIVNPKQ